MAQPVEEKNNAGVPVRADTLSPIPEQLPLYRLRPEPSWMGYRTPSLNEASWLGPAIGEDDLNLTACDGTDQVRSSQGERYCDKCWQLLPAPFEPVEHPSINLATGAYNTPRARNEANPTPAPQYDEPDAQARADLQDISSSATSLFRQPTALEMLDSNYKMF